jgi:glucose-6-phosphate 1-dehydrogenase
LTITWVSSRSRISWPCAFGNAIFEPLWRREAIADVQITIAEDLGVVGRGGYYERSGALRDMMQNHLLQLLCIVARSPWQVLTPIPFEMKSSRFCDALKRSDPTTISTDNVVRGEYRAGVAAGVAVPGYLDEPGVDPSSHTETFVAVRTEIENWRWGRRAVRFAPGKRLGTRGAEEIVISFCPVPHPIF